MKLAAMNQYQLRITSAEETTRVLTMTMMMMTPWVTLT